MTVSIACISGKGGVGKTTTTSSLVGALAERGKRVLAVDMDPQSNLTSGFGLNPYTLTGTIGSLLVDDQSKPADVVLPTQWKNVFLLPANPDLSGVEGELASALNRELQLRKVLERPGGSADFDIVMFDTPPNFGFHTVSVMAAVDYILVPVQMSSYAIKGLKEVLRTVHAVTQQLNPKLRVLGLLPTFVNPRTKFSRDMLEGLHAVPNLRVFESMIMVTVKLQETALAGAPITAYAPRSRAAESYRELAGEVLTALA